MLAYYGSHILHTAVAYFDVVLVEKGVILVLLREVFRYKLKEGFNKDTLNTSQHSPTGNFLIALNYQNTSGNSKTATPASQLNGLSSQGPAPTTIQAKDVIYA